MKERSPGYVDDVAYPATYIRELSPAWLACAAALSGITPPDLAAPFRYLELGCGSGVSTVAHARRFPRAAFHACDASAASAGRARALARQHGARLTVHACTFSDLEARSLPAMDFIALHGVYSWVSASERRAVRRLVNHLLKPGGLLYVSYNCLPGWVAEQPLQRLLAELSAVQDGDSANRVSLALARLQAPTTLRWRYFDQTPAARQALQSYADSDRAYLAHEFLNATWEPMYSVDVHAEFARQDVQFLTSATLADNYPALLFDAAMARDIVQLPTRRLRALASDFAVNRQFRRDVFVRAPGAALDHRAWRRVMVCCRTEPATLPMEIRVPRGTLRLDPGFMAAVGRLMARGPSTLGHAVDVLSNHSHDSTAVARNLQYLVAGDVLTPCGQAAPG